jgi:hypothetical protein
MPRPWPHDPPGRALVLAYPDYNDLDSQTRPPVAPPTGTTVAALGPPAHDLDGAGGPAKSLAGFHSEAEAVTRLLRGQPGWQVTLLEPHTGFRVRKFFYPPAK